jgi:hypothetical protein
MEVFSAEQIDALAMAITNVDNNAGFIIGDQTGVGKGRVVAGMMRYAKRIGRIPIFVTKDPGLYADMYRDTADIGMPKFDALVTNADLRGQKIIYADDRPIASLTKSKLGAAIRFMQESKSLPEGYDALFTTYTQMQSVQGKTPERVTAVEALAPNCILILDESHEAGGQKNFMKMKDPKTGEVIRTRASIIRDILDLSPAALYSSATYAKNPDTMDLLRKTDMSKAVDKIEDLAQAIRNGGVPLQQVVSNMLVERGQYRRAERSYDGVRMELKGVESDIVEADKATELLRDVYEFDLLMQDIKELLQGEAEEDGDVVVDAFSNDQDTLNITATADIVAADFNVVSGVEAVTKATCEEVNVGPVKSESTLSKYKT